MTALTWYGIPKQTDAIRNSTVRNNLHFDKFWQTYTVSHILEM